MGKVPEKGFWGSCTMLATRPVETNEGIREMTDDPLCPGLPQARVDQ
jgi:hypothetical protein